HVTVIDTIGGAVRNNMTVVVEGARITQVEASDKARLVPGTFVVDASRKYLIPGLWDMHFHSFFVGRRDWTPGARDVMLPLLIANGVTGIRDMGSDLDSIIQVRQDIASGTLLGPRMVVAGPMLDGPNTPYCGAIEIATADDGRRAVDRLKSRGV